MVDANGDYSLEDADHLRRLDEFNLMMVEQPLSYSDIIEHAVASAGDEDRDLPRRVHPQPRRRGRGHLDWRPG